ncbi:MAG: outer membrane beta-barrel protein [bacterium]|nr:outer membrane beta-barrel protein [bacterium]
MTPRQLCVILSPYANPASSRTFTIWGEITMCRKLLALAVIAAAIGILPASAGDFNRRFHQKPLFSWAGFYGGFNFGHGFDGQLSHKYNYGYAGYSDIVRYDGGKGSVAGAQIGYNWMLASHLFAGLETDIQWSGITSSQTENPCPGCFFPYSITTTQRLKWLGTSVVRLGYVNKNWLVGILGGAAYGQVDETQAYSSIFGSSSYTTKMPGVGFTVGGVIEYAFWDDWSAKLQYNYVGLYLGGSHSSYGYSTDSNYATHIVRAGLNKHF